MKMPEDLPKVENESNVETVDNGQIGNNNQPEGTPKPQEQEPEGKKDFKEGTPEWAQKKIDELTKHRRTAETEAEFWKQQAISKELNQPSGDNQEHSKQEVQNFEDPNAPKVDDYQDYGDYIKAATDYAVNKALSEKQKLETTKNRVNKFKTSLLDFGKDKPDFKEVVFNPGNYFNHVMMETMMDSQHGPELAYHLGKNPEEANRIYHLPPVAAIREMAILEHKLFNNVPKPNHITQTPQPIEPISGSVNISNKHPKDMSMDEYAQKRMREDKTIKV